MQVSDQIYLQHCSFKRQVSAIISPDKAVVLKSRREKENENIIAPMLKAIDAHDQLPFELCAMEALLHATVM